MKLFPKIFVLTGICLCFVPLVRASAKRLAKSDLPSAVQKTAAEQTRGATVKGYSREDENGQRQYEVEMISNGHTKDVIIATDGSVLEVEEQLEISALPASVQSGFKSKAGKGKIAKVESITKHGTIVAYEAQVRTMGKHSEIQVGPDGKSLEHQE